MNKRKSEKPYQPTEQELQNAFVNPNFNKKNSQPVNKNSNVERQSINRSNQKK